MVIGDVVLDGAINNSVNGFGGLVLKLADVLILLQTLGIVLIIWFVFEIVALFFQLKRLKKMDVIMEDMARIEKKIDNLKKK
jgi:biopolymer transport protein ExbB/TolQ